MSFETVKRQFDAVRVEVSDSPMTSTGTFIKTAFLLGIMCSSAALSWLYSASLAPFVFVGALGGLGLGLVTIFMPHVARYTAIPYALCQGMALGLLSLVAEVRAPGIVELATLLTTATAFAMLLLYRLEIIKVTETVKALIVSATAGIGLVYMILLVLGLFGVNTSHFFTSASTLSLGFSIVVVVLAAFNLLLDFALIDEGVDRGLPKYMEWYGAFSILLTLIWLYVEIVRLLQKVSQKKN